MSRSWPPFKFKIIRVHPVPSLEPPPNQRWTPPRIPETDRISHGARNKRVGLEAAFYHNGQEIQRVPTFTESGSQAIPFSTISAYNDNGYLSFLNYDATRSEVGNAPRQRQQQQSSSSNGRENEEPAQQGEEFMNWHHLGYHNNENTRISCARYDEEERRPFAHREGVTWPDTLLPHSSRGERGDSTPAGRGVNIHLGVLIALLAFSVRQEHIETYLEECFKDGKYQPPSGAQASSVWAGRYGVLVKVFASPNESTAQDLEDFGKGEYRNYSQPMFQ